MLSCAGKGVETQNNYFEALNFIGKRTFFSIFQENNQISGFIKSKVIVRRSSM